MSDTQELKPLTRKEREFIDYIVYHSLDRLDAYSMAYAQKIDEENKRKASAKASRIFSKANVQFYYQALMADIAEQELKRAAWTKEKSVEKLTRFIDKIEQELYPNEDDENASGGKITMARTNAIISAIKELNLMHGLNENNVKVSGINITFSGEDKLED